MTQLEFYLKTCDLRGFTYEMHPECEMATIETEYFILRIERRNWYCDRGRFGFWAESKDYTIRTIDAYDGFPRYFFSLQRAIDEMVDWYNFSVQQIEKGK